MSAGARTDPRERILEAATTLYGERGYYETRVEDIVARARVSKRTVYEHFRDLGQLRFAVYERAMQGTLLELARIASDRSEPDRLRAALSAMFKSIATTPHLGRVISYEFRLPEPKNIALRQQVLAFFVSMLVEGTSEDHARGRCPRPPDELMMVALLGAIEGLATHFLDRADTADAERAVDVALELYRTVYPFDPAAG